MAKYAADFLSFDLGIDLDEADNPKAILLDDLTKNLNQCQEFKSPSTKLVTDVQLSLRSHNKHLNELFIGKIQDQESVKKQRAVGKILFGDLTPNIAPKKRLVAGSLAPNPFLLGRVHQKPHPEVLLSLHVWMTGRNVTELDRSGMFPLLLCFSSSVCYKTELCFFFSVLQGLDQAQPTKECRGNWCRFEGAAVWQHDHGD